jgi:hypothetical protein
VWAELRIVNVKLVVHIVSNHWALKASNSALDTDARSVSSPAEKELSEIDGWPQQSRSERVEEEAKHHRLMATI